MACCRLWWYPLHGYQVSDMMSASASATNAQSATSMRHTLCSPSTRRVPVSGSTAARKHGMYRGKCSLPSCIVLRNQAPALRLRHAWVQSLTPWWALRAFMPADMTDCYWQDAGSVHGADTCSGLFSIQEGMHQCRIAASQSSFASHQAFNLKQQV